MSRDESTVGRRDFLRGASAVGAAIAASPLLGASRPAIEPASDITDLSATELSRAIRKREIRCDEGLLLHPSSVSRELVCEPLERSTKFQANSRGTG